MNSDQIIALEHVIEVIDNNLEKPLCLNTLSKEVGISKYHLTRLFHSLSDKSLMAYVRGRRLSASLSDLMNSDANIVDIAVKYQFDYEQSYIRSFQRCFHMTPAKYRRSRKEMPIEPKIDINLMRRIGQGLIMEPKIIRKPSFHVQGIKSEINHEENLTQYTTNQLAMLFINKYKEQIPNQLNSFIYLALVLYSNNPEVSNAYLPCVETKVLNCIEEPYYVYSLPSQEYAVFRYVGLHAPTEVTYRTLKDLYDYITWDWLKNTTYKQSHPYHFERMDGTVCSNNYCEMDIYYPVGI